MKESKAGNNEASATKADDAGKYPGVAIDVADGDETNAADVKERTLTLGFNREVIQQSRFMQWRAAVHSSSVRSTIICRFAIAPISLISWLTRSMVVVLANSAMIS